MNLKPQYIFWSMSVFALLFGIGNINSATDLQFHDTYFVIANFHIAIFFTVLFLIIGGVYYLLEKRNWELTKFLTLFHVWGTLLIVILFIGFYIFFNSAMMSGMPRRYYKFDGDMNFVHDIHLIVPVLIIIFLIAQCSFVLNIVASMFKK